MMRAWSGPGHAGPEVSRHATIGRNGSYSIEQGADRGTELLGRGAAALVRRQHRTVGVDAADSIVEAACFVGETEVLEHHHGGEDRRGWVDDVATGDVRRGTVDRFEVGVVLTVAAGGGETEAADGAGGAVGENIAVQ